MRTRAVTGSMRITCTESALGFDTTFLTLVRRYIDIKDFTVKIIWEFVEKIYVYKAERIDCRRVKHIKIVNSYIGNLTRLFLHPQQKSSRRLTIS